MDLATTPPDRPSSAQPDDNAERRRKGLVLCGKVLLAAVLLWLLYRLGLLEAAPLLALLKSPWLVAAAALLLLASYPLVALRWGLLLRSQQIDVAYADVFKVTYASAFVGLYLPGMVGGDIARVALGLSMSGSQISALALSVMADRLLGLVGLLIVGLLASLAYLAYLDPSLAGYAELRTLVLLLVGVFAIGVAATFVAAILGRRLRRFAVQHGWPERGLPFRLMAQALEVARSYRRHPERLLLGVVLSVAAHATGLAALTLLAWGIDLGGLSLWKFAVAGAVTAIANAIPLTPGGLGIGEAAFAQLALWLEPAAAPPPYATVFLAYRVVIALTLIPAVSMLAGRLRRSP